MSPELSFTATFDIAVGPPVDAGTGCRMIPVLGGTVRGSRLNGTILPGGADWQDPGAAEAVSIGGRWVLETNDHVRIQVETPGIRRASADILSALAAGQEVESTRYYFRVAPQFKVTDPAYTWLRQSLYVGIGAKNPGGVRIDVFAVI
jgi:hypothetical protein